MKKTTNTTKKTKPRILNTALRLFNELGLAKVTLRSIANEMGISQGNLCYHYKKREDILEALYHQLVAKMDEVIALASSSPPSLATSFMVSKEMMQHFFDYRFFMLDFVQIMREQKKIHEHYQQLSQLREQQFIGMFQLWVQEGLMRPEEFEGEYQSLYIRYNILGDFWLSSAITKGAINFEVVEEYNLIIFQNIYPYLTPKGKKQFKEIIA